MNGVRPVIISAFGPPALACLRSWGRAGMKPGMVCVQAPGEPKPASSYLYSSTCLSRNELHTERGLNKILTFLVEFDASGLTCIDENIAQWLNNSKLSFPEGVTLWLPPNEMLHRVLSKGEQIDIARKVGLSVLPTYIFFGNECRVDIPHDHFPLCLRPSLPDSVTPLFKVENSSSLGDLKSFLESRTIREPVIGQPFKNLPNLVVHGTRTADGNTLGMTGFIVERKFQGVTLTLTRACLDDELKNRCIAFTETMDLVGNYHFEFLFDPVSGDSHFLEINHRYGGTTAKALVCGYQEPLYALQSYGIEVPVSSTVNNLTSSSIKALCKVALYTLAGRITPLDYPEEKKIMRLWSTLKCLFICRDEVFAWDDLSGTATFFLGDIPGRIKNIAAVCRRLLSPTRGDTL